MADVIRDAVAEATPPRRRRARSGVTALVGLAAVAVIILRRLDAVANPQFWAEDGLVWFADAYARGWHALLAPSAGYLQTSSRLVAWVAEVFPLRWAPEVYNSFGIAFQALPAVLLATPLFDDLIPDWRPRALLIGLYLALPNSGEVQANLTNGQWHLAIVLVMLVLARPPRSRAGRIACGSLAALAGLSGPYCLFLLPFLAWHWWASGRDRWLRVLLVIDVAASAAQLFEVLSGGGGRYPGFTANIALLGHVVSAQVFTALAAGAHGYSALDRHGGWALSGVLWLALVCGISVVIAAAIRGRREVRIFVGFCALVLLASLFDPGKGGLTGFWEALLTPTFGQRYWVLPMLAVVAAVVWLLGSRRRWAVGAAVLALAVIVGVGVRLDFVQPPYRNLHFQQRLAACLAKPPGTVCTIPINPAPFTFQIRVRPAAGRGAERPPSR